MKAKQQGGISLQAVEEIAARVATEQSMELVEVALQKIPQGKTLCIYVDQPNGVTLDDCERFHKAVLPFLEDVEYDFLEVSSPGVDRPIKTLRDFEKNRDGLVELKLFAPLEGVKTFEGILHAMDEQQVTLLLPDGSEKVFARKTVAIIKPVIVFEDEEQ